MRRKKKGVLKYSLLLDKQPISYIYIYLILYVYIYIYIFRIRRREMFRNIFLILDGIVIRIRRNVQKERRRMLDKQPIVTLYVYIFRIRRRKVFRNVRYFWIIIRIRRSPEGKKTYIYIFRVRRGCFEMLLLDGQGGRNVQKEWTSRKEGRRRTIVPVYRCWIIKPPPLPSIYIYRRVILPFLLMKSRGCG